MIRHGLALLVAVGVATSQAHAQGCEPTPETHAVRILGTDASGALSPDDFPAVHGTHSFYQRLDNGWVFALVRTELGWSVRVFDAEPVGEAADLTALTPPLRGAPNPRDIEGWHFRNADNTAPNAGEVNAPQRMRAFVLSPDLAGTAGLRPPAAAGTPGPQDGMGWLSIVDYGLANPVPGTKARMNYVQFDACLAWPRSAEETATLHDQARLAYSDEERELFGACGLDLQRDTLDARHRPRTLGGDIDGDGALDEVAQVVRGETGTRAFALCRAGTWLDLLGSQDASIDGLRAGLADQIEAWQWVTKGGPVPRHLQGYTLPQSDGDYLILERVEKEAFALYWTEGRLRGQRLYGHVEP